MKAVFRTYAGSPYMFDPITGRVERAELDMERGSKWKGGQIFSRMQVPNRDEIVRNVQKHQKSVQLNITEECSNRCLYRIYSGHYRYERTHASRVMNIELAKEAIRQYLLHSDPAREANMAFYGGEPLMDGAFGVMEEVVEFAHSIAGERPVNFSITSNGRHVTSDRLRFLVSNNVYLRISLDGPKKIHDRYRRSREGYGTFEEVMTNLSAIKAYSEDYYKMVGFVCVLCPELEYRTIRDFFNTHDLVKEHDLTISFLQLTDQTLPFPIDEPRFIRDCAEMYRDCTRSYYDAAVSGKLNHYTFERALLGKNLGWLHELQTNGGDETIGPNGCCIPGARKCFVDTSGTIYACEKIGRCYPLGNIKTYVDTGIASRMIEEYCNLSEKECLECWCARLCDLCFVAAREGAVLKLTRKRSACQERRDLFKALLRLYASLSEAIDPNSLTLLLPKSIDLD
jgi:uncharacterized protein